MAFCSIPMVKVYSVYIKVYPNLRELSLLRNPLIRSMIAKSLSASMVGPEASLYDHQVLIHYMAGLKVSFKPLQDFLITKS